MDVTYGIDSWICLGKFSGPLIRTLLMSLVCLLRRSIKVPHLDLSMGNPPSDTPAMALAAAEASEGLFSCS